MPLPLGHPILLDVCLLHEGDGVGWLVDVGDRDLLHWSTLERNDKQSREALTNWVIANRTNITRLEVLVRSPFVAMGVSLANALLGNFMSSTSQDRHFVSRLKSVLDAHGLGELSHGCFGETPPQIKVAVQPLS